MNEYELIKSLIRLIPLISIFGMSCFMLRFKWFYRLPIVFLAGWLIIIFTTQMFWDYSFDYAPTEEIMAEVGSKDGGARVGSIIIGWVYAIVIMLSFELVKLAYSRLKSSLYKHNKVTNDHD